MLLVPAPSDSSSTATRVGSRTAHATWEKEADSSCQGRRRSPWPSSSRLRPRSGTKTRRPTRPSTTRNPRWCSEGLSESGTQGPRFSFSAAAQSDICERSRNAGASMRASSRSRSSRLTRSRFVAAGRAADSPNTFQPVPKLYARKHHGTDPRGVKACQRPVTPPAPKMPQGCTIRRAPGREPGRAGPRARAAGRR